MLNLSDVLKIQELDSPLSEASTGSDTDDEDVFPVRSFCVRDLDQLLADSTQSLRANIDVICNSPTSEHMRNQCADFTWYPDYDADDDDDDSECDSSDSDSELEEDGFPDGFPPRVLCCTDLAQML